MKIIDELEGCVQDLFENESSGHDIHHLRRVLNNALKIQEKEGGDRTVVAVSAFLHDIHRIIQKDSGIFCSPKESLPRVKEILDKTKLDENLKVRVMHCIEFHEEYDFGDGKTVHDIETKIIQDADNLDAIGAIGIGRTFSFGGANDIPMWIPEQAIEREHFDESVLDNSTIHHFYSKLLRLKDNMNTETGKEMAEKRHGFMETFLEEFFSEWDYKTL